MLKGKTSRAKVEGKRNTKLPNKIVWQIRTENHVIYLAPGNTSPIDYDSIPIFMLLPKHAGAKKLIRAWSGGKQNTCTLFDADFSDAQVTDCWET